MKVPKLRFKDFNDAWILNKVGNICDFIVPGRNKPTEFKGDIPWITTPDIEQNGIVTSSKKNLNITIEEAKIIGSKIVPKNSILISCVGDLGLIAISGVDLIINQQLHAFLPRENIYSKFLLYALTTQKPYMEKVATKTAVPYMNKDNCNSIPVIMPSLPEQTKIANFLTAIDEKITQLTQKCDLLAQYKKGVMQQIFSQKLRFKDDDGREFPEWEEKYFGEIFSFINTNSLSRELLSHQNGSIKNIHYGDIHTKYRSYFKIEEERVPYIKDTVDLSKITTEHYCKVGDLVIADASEDYNDIGKTIEIINLNSERLLAGLHTYIARDISNKMALGFGGYLMQAAYVRKQIKILATGVSVLGISKASLAKIQIYIPSKPEQTKIANFLTAIDNKITQAQAQLDAVKRYKKGLLQQMFV